MKKIVALVLSLVMVLGLATVASAATSAETLDEALAVVGSTSEVKAAAGAVADAKMFATYMIFETDTETKAVTPVGPMAEAVAPVEGGYVFVDGKNIRYFAPADVVNYDVVVTAVKVAAKDVYACGDVQVDEDTTFYVDAKGNYYKADGDVAGNLGGKYIALTECTDEYKALIKDHTYDYDLKAMNHKQTITNVFCKDCKKVFAFVDGTPAEAVAKFSAGNYTEATGVPSFNEGTVYVATTGSAAATDSAVVESAQTFDAGIAMYVGMSVMAAAGSAVVLKKKD